MNDAPAALRDLILLLARLCFGGMMILEHGWGKLDKLLSGGTPKFPDPLGIGVKPSLILASGAETVCAAFIVLGLFTRLNALPLAFTMGVAAFVVHQGDPLGKREPALLYLMGTLLLFLTGPGRIAVQSFLAKRLPRKGLLAFLLG